VIATIGEHYVSQGATRGPAAWRKLDGLGSLARTRSLGIAISADELGWVTLCDSERYTADYALARHIAGALATRVRVIGIWDVSQLELDQYLGPGDSVCENRTPSAYYDKHEPDEREGWSFLSFDDLEPNFYDAADKIVTPNDDEYGEFEPD
jgi:hypothetical protein